MLVKGIFSQDFDFLAPYLGVGLKGTKYERPNIINNYQILQTTYRILCPFERNILQEGNSISFTLLL